MLKHQDEVFLSTFEENIVKKIKISYFLKIILIITEIIDLKTSIILRVIHNLKKVLFKIKNSVRQKCLISGELPTPRKTPLEQKH